MSVKTTLTNNAVNSFTGMLDSAYNLAGSIIDAKGRTKKADMLFESNKDVLSTKYQTEIDELYQTLPESIQFDQYQLRVDAFNQDFLSKARSAGYDARTLAWLENEFLPNQKASNERAVAAVTDYATNSWVANNANNKANDLAADPSLDADEAAKQYEQYYDSVGLGDIENGPNTYGFLTPSEYNLAVRLPKAVQVFRQLSEDPENGYLASPTYSKEDTIKQALATTGYRPDNVQEKALVEECDKVLTEIGQEKQKQVTYAQNAITSKFATMHLNGEDYDADDVIEAARDAGAFMADGKTVNMMWVSFLTPYIEASAKTREIAAATEKINEELGSISEITVEEAQDVARRVSGGTFEYSASSVKDVQGDVSASGGKISLPKKISYGAPVVTNKEAEGTGLQVNEDVAIQPEGTVVVNGQNTDATVEQFDNGKLYIVSDTPVESLEQYALPSNPKEDGQSGQYVYQVSSRKSFKESFEEYQPYEGSDKEELSDIALQANSLREMTAGTGLDNMFTSDGSINYSGSEGKHTYKFEGLEDITIEHNPVLLALCQEKGIEYDTDSYSVYTLAKYVKDLEDSGAFTDPNKAKAVQYLATARLDKTITPEEYNAKVMDIKARGILSDTEIKDYGLSSHMFSGDFGSNSAFQKTYNQALPTLFASTFGKDKTEDEIKSDTEKSNQWFTLQQDFERELKLAYQLDPVGMQNNPLPKVNEIVEKLTDKAFADELYKALTSSYLTLGTIFSGTTDKVQLADNANVSEALQRYFDNGSYSEYLDADITKWVNDAYYNIDTKSGKPKAATAERQIEETSQKRYNKSYSDLTLDEQRTVLFSYAYARTRMEFNFAVSDTFGYGMDEIYGNVTVSSTDGGGGGFAVVTNDGRVYMSGDAPNGGHNWIIGSVSERTLKNIQNGATTISYAEISSYGVKYFNDENMTFTKEGASLTKSTNIFQTILSLGGVDFRDKDKEIELSDIYGSVQPGRYNGITDIDKGWRGY